MNWSLRILEKIEEFALVEELQRRVWPGSETDVVPTHVLQTAVHNGGLVIGAVVMKPSTTSDEMPEEGMAGFVFGFPGFYQTPDGPRLKHCSHMLGVDPRFRDLGIGFALKRAQWQMVRHQGIDRITWTYDPLLSPNAHLNIARLGAVCNTYYQDYYGAMRDSLNTGLPSDRFQVDWWVNSRRVYRRLSRRARAPLTLDQLTSAEVEIVNPATPGPDGGLVPPDISLSPKAKNKALILVEIPENFAALKQTSPTLALKWRLLTRSLFEELFEQGFLVTDFIHHLASQPRSYYVLSHGESTL